MTGLVLVVGDRAGAVAEVCRVDGGYRVATVASGSEPECLASLEREPPEAVILELDASRAESLSLLECIRRANRSVPVIVRAGSDATPSLARAMEIGAYDYVAGDVDRRRLLTTLANAVERHRLERRLGQLERGLASVATDEPPAGNGPPGVPPGPPMRLEDLERLAIENALRHTNGNVSAVVRHLGIGRTTLYRKLKKYGLQ